MAIYIIVSSFLFFCLRTKSDNKQSSLISWGELTFHSVIIIIIIFIFKLGMKVELEAWLLWLQINVFITTRYLLKIIHDSHGFFISNKNLNFFIYFHKFNKLMENQFDWRIKIFQCDMEKNSTLIYFLNIFKIME